MFGDDPAVREFDRGGMEITVLLAAAGQFTRHQEVLATWLNGLRPKEGDELRMYPAHRAGRVVEQRYALVCKGCPPMEWGDCRLRWPTLTLRTEITVLQGDGSRWGGPVPRGRRDREGGAMPRDFDEIRLRLEPDGRSNWAIVPDLDGVAAAAIRNFLFARGYHVPVPEGEILTLIGECAREHVVLVFLPIADDA